MVTDYRDRALEDILNVERELRQNAERMARDYRALVVELAQRFAGEALEARRRDNPVVPSAWTAADWTAFWEDVSLRPAGGWTVRQDGNGHEALERRIVQLEGEIATVRARLEQAQERLAKEALQKRLAETTRTRGGEKPKGEAKRQAKRILTPEQLPETHRQLVEELQGLPAIPVAPQAFKAQLKPDNALRYRRKVLILYTLARGGYSSRMEIDRVVSVVEKLSERTSSVRTPVDELAQAGLLISETIRMTSPFETGLALNRLSEDGRRLCKTWGWQVVESEWERVLRLHQGETQEAHSVILLAFALHARLRGWNVTVLPEVEGNAAPDVLVEKDGEGWYVEVERGDGSRRKWKNLAKLNGGKVALCAADEKGREQLVLDCKELRLGGVATDLRTLIFTGGELRKMVEITPADELWTERW